ncbi:MAG TPA: Glu/Leu/Phe/Val dehydrogenase dimerization domain-containing protein [Solirubrobacteraceae bacterium]|jgi:leucine dehydrogenase|nr:Glu/Leu/Phe/Val dehydrogenase dimerization domain-containing protein [Solirubrobacteraceae bacterium]
MRQLADIFGHEQLHLFRDPATGLTGVVAIHSTALGPAMGGLRLRRYRDIEAAAVDAMRLARAMTLKNSAAGLSLGGGKAVLLDDGEWHDREARLLAFADVVEQLDGRYITAEDIGTTTEDMDVLATRTEWVVGRSRAGGGLDDPSPATAHTVFAAIEAGVRHALGVDSLRGMRVGVLGAGKVGAPLIALLGEAGAELTVADVDPARAVAAVAAAGGRGAVVGLEGFVTRDLDVLSPCAVGEVIALQDVASLRCRVVAGAANNPLVDDATAVAVHERGILYVPDFIANCGGIIQVAGEHEGLAPEAIAAQQEAAIARIEELLEEAEAHGAMPRAVAVERALQRVALSAARA